MLKELEQVNLAASFSQQEEVLVVNMNQAIEMRLGDMLWQYVMIYIEV